MMNLSGSVSHPQSLCQVECTLLFIVLYLKIQNLTCPYYDLKVQLCCINLKISDFLVLNLGMKRNDNFLLFLF